MTRATAGPRLNDLRALLAGTALLVGCPTDPVLLPMSGCTPGAQVACACPGGSSGVQVCQTDRTLGSCLCGVDGGIDASASDTGMGMHDTGAADLGAVDLGLADVGSGDVKTPDVREVDVGSPVDVGTPDTGPADVGADVGARDTGTVDTGSPTDVGSTDVQPAGCVLGEGESCPRTSSTAPSCCAGGRTCTRVDALSSRCTAAVGQPCTTPNGCQQSVGFRCEAGRCCLSNFRACEGAAECCSGRCAGSDGRTCIP